jgi:deoxyribonuclease-4
MIIGSHISQDNILEETKNVYNKGGRIIQLFVEFDEKTIEKYKVLRKFLDDHKMLCVVHISYNIVITKKWNKYSWWVRELIGEIRVAEILGSFCVVLHINKNYGSIDESIKNLCKTLTFVSNNVSKNIQILLETPSGQGKEFCIELECLKKILNKLNNSKFGICVDTCHIFVAGYDIKKNPIKYFEDFDNMIGLSNLRLVHLNDSYSDCGSRVDRHENIGNGYIGLPTLTKIVQYCDQHNIPMVIETKNRYEDIKYFIQ